MVGISPSYLNLIEHNRRRIAGRLLGDIARALNVEAGFLVDGAEREIVEKMQAAASKSQTSAEIDRTEEIATRYPGWSQLVAEQADRIAALELRVQELTDRMAHDPLLAGSLHAVISAVTSIRSAASILTSDEKLDADWQSRFHKNIHDDAVRLANDSEALIGFLEQPNSGVDELTPIDRVEKWLADNPEQWRSLELTPQSLEHVVQNSGLSEAANTLLSNQLHTHLNDAIGMPFLEFGDLAKKLNYRPDAIAAAMNQPLVGVLRRLATLQPEDGHPVTGLAVCDASGALIVQKQTPNFRLFRGLSACANWPIFTALGQIGRPISCTVALPGTPETRFQCHAIAEQSQPQLRAAPIVTSTMLVIADPPLDDAPIIDVGPTCRICPRSDCAARRETSVLELPV